MINEVCLASVGEFEMRDMARQKIFNTVSKSCGARWNTVMHHRNDDLYELTSPKNDTETAAVSKSIFFISQVCAVFDFFFKMKKAFDWFHQRSTSFPEVKSSQDQKNRQIFDKIFYTIKMHENANFVWSMTNRNFWGLDP